MSNKIGHAVFMAGFFASWGWLWRTPGYALALGLVCGIGWAAMLVRWPEQAQKNSVASDQAVVWSDSTTRWFWTGLLTFVLLTVSLLLWIGPVYLRGANCFLMAQFAAFAAVYRSVKRSSAG